MLYSWKHIKLGWKEEECSNQNSIIISIKRRIFVDFNVQDKQLESYKFNFHLIRMFVRRKARQSVRESQSQSARSRNVVRTSLNKTISLKSEKIEQV